MEDSDYGGLPPGGGSREPAVTGGGFGSGNTAAGGERPVPAANAGEPGLPGKQKGRKRRKRRRGRKVFARDAMPGAIAPAAVTADAGRDPVSPIAADPSTLPQPPAFSPQVLVNQQARYGRGRGTGDQPVYAALDLGTNNCRLLVAIPGRPGQFRVVDAFSRIVRLGEGLTASGRLSQPAMDRAVEALKVCADKLSVRDIRRQRLIATEACRSAANGEEFLARVAEETGLALEIINRETEARLAVSGCGSLVERETDAVVLFDIGGGSSEIALIDVSQRRSPRLASHIVAWTSLPVGVVSLAERFGGREVTPESFAAMVADVEGMLEKFAEREKLGALARGTRFHLLGTSGTVTTLAGVHLGLERYDRRYVDGLWMSASEVDAMMKKLLSWTFHERVANPCIGADRADLVLAGCAILEAVRRVWPAERLRVADRGLREGILSELMAEDGAWARGNRKPWDRRGEGAWR